MAKINITIVTYNRLALTRMCLESLLQYTRGDYEVHVVDNNSNDGTQEYLRHIAKENPDLVYCIFLGKNMGISVAANLGWSASDAPYHLKIDNDMLILKPDWLELLITMSQRNPDIGMVAYQFCDWHKTKEITLTSGDAFIESDCCGGGCVLIPPITHKRFGFWNEDYGIYGFEDLDYGTRVQCAGIRIGYVPNMDKVENKGYDSKHIDDKIEVLKNNNIESDDRGKKLFVLNKFMFEKGIRKLYVPRKYLTNDFEKQNPMNNTIQNVHFKLNPDYEAITRLQEKYLPLFSFDELQEQVAVKFDKDAIEKALDNKCVFPAVKEK